MATPIVSVLVVLIIDPLTVNLLFREDDDVPIIDKKTVKKTQLKSTIKKSNLPVNYQKYTNYTNNQLKFIIDDHVQNNKNVIYMKLKSNPTKQDLLNYIIDYNM